MESEEAKQEPESKGYTQILKLSGFNVTMINKLKIKGRSRKHIRRDE